MLAPLTARLAGESDNEFRWRRGAEGEERTAKRLATLLAKHDVEILHDLRVPGSRANIDHLAIGPGGVTVIDSKLRKGELRLSRGELWLGERRRTDLVTSVQKQVAVVRAVLEDAGLGDVNLRGAICWLRVGGLPDVGSLRVDGVLIEGPRPVAKLARRVPDGRPVDVEQVCLAIERRLGRDAAAQAGESVNGVQQTSRPHTSISRPPRRPPTTVT